MSMSDFFGVNKNTYEVRFKCRNCKQIKAMPIPKGISIKEYNAEGVTCPTCGTMKMEVMNKELLKDG